jgi:hypothetical protein
VAKGDATRVRDVIVCATGPDEVLEEDWKSHPPVGMKPRLLFENAVPEVDLGGGVVLTSLEDGESDCVMDACSPKGLNFKAHRTFGPRYTFVRERDLADYHREPFAWDEDAGLLRDALMLSRLIRDNGFSLQYAARIVERVGSESMIVPMYGDYGKSAHRNRRGREWLCGDEARELVALLDAYWSMELPGRVARAFWRCEWAVWTPWADPMLPIIVSGLEALLKVGRSRPTAQFVTRACALAGELGIDEVDEDLCGELYAGRSDWSHGSSVELFAEVGDDPTEADDIRAKIATLQDLLRAAIRRAIEAPEFCAAFVSDDAILERWGSDLS